MNSRSDRVSSPEKLSSDHGLSKDIDWIEAEGNYVRLHVDEIARRLGLD